MAEALVRHLGGGAVESFSAGTEPKAIHPLTIRALAESGIDASAARSKNVREFLGRKFDYVITVCDRAKESCPLWPGAKEQIHWSIEDPAEATGTEAERLHAFVTVRNELAQRIRLLLNVAGIEPRSAAPR
jgi:arsenate reductase